MKAGANLAFTRRFSNSNGIGLRYLIIHHPRFLEESANEILTAIVHGMRRDETSNQVRLSATRALNNSLEFTKANFDKDAERHYIMQVGLWTS